MGYVNAVIKVDNGEQVSEKENASCISKRIPSAFGRLNIHLSRFISAIGHSNIHDYL
jgi:hypothetical protein